MYNKSVLLSTQPRWCFEIINGKDTELRKTKPKLQPPFKVLPQKPQRQKNIIDTRKQEKSIMDKFMSTENVAQTDTETK